MSIEDHRLLDAAKNMDRDALSAIFDLYSSAIYKYALRLCHDPIQADDIVGEVLSRLVLNLRMGKGPTYNLRSYLYQIAYHLVIDYQRKNKHLADLEDTSPLPEQGLSLVATVENKVLLDVLNTSLHQCLTPDQQQVIILRFIEGFSVQETADIIGKDVNNIKVIQNRAIAKLRMILNNQNEEIEAIGE